MFEGDLIEGELEIGQIAGLIQEVKSAEGIYGRLQCGKTRNSCYFLIIEIMTKIKLYIVLLFLGVDCSKPTVRIINVRC
jgi:hypothetical protein